MPAFNLEKLGRLCGKLMTHRDAFQALARYLLLALLFYAPWAYGTTRPVLVNDLDNALLLCFGLHLTGLVRECRLPRYPVVPTGCLALIILQCIWMSFNARSYLDKAFWEFVPLIQPFPNQPGSWDKAASLFTTKTVCSMSGAFLVASDLIADTVWKLRLWRTMAIVGCSVILYGVIEKGLGSDSVISMYRDQSVGSTSFGPYRYHGNAGAYLNLIWPVLLALFIQSRRKRHAYVEQALWVFWLVIALAACFINTSRAAATITVFTLIVAAISFAPFFRESFIRSNRIARMLAIILIVSVVAILVYGGVTTQLQGRLDRMLNLGKADEDESRFLVDGACLRMIPEAGWLGFGPGTFSSVFPFHTLYLGVKIQGFWLYAHEDYLQTVVEYGYFGTLLWSTLLFGGLWMTIFRGLQSSVRTNDRIMFRAFSLTLGGLALHSLVDFPLQVASIELYASIFLAYAWNTSDNLMKNEKRY